MPSCTIEDHRLTLRGGFLALPLIVSFLGAGGLYYILTTYTSTSNEFMIFIPIASLLSLFGPPWFLRSSRPLILDKQADRILGYPYALSSAQKVSTRSISVNDGNIYVTELHFPEKAFRLSRSGWSGAQLPQDADHITKKVAAFLGIPAEPYHEHYPTIKLFEK